MEAKAKISIRKQTERIWWDTLEQCVKMNQENISKSFMEHFILH